MIIYNTIVNWKEKKIQIEYHEKITLTSLDKYMKKHYPDFKYNQINFKEKKKDNNIHKYVCLKLVEKK